MDKTQLIIELGNIESENVLLESQVSQLEIQLKGFKDKDTQISVMTVIGFLLCLTGIGAIVGVPLLIMIYVGSKNIVNLSAELNSKLKIAKDSIVANRGKTVSLHTQLALLNV